MHGFFNMDGPIYRYGSLLADLLLLTVLWFLCSLPIVTIGASTTAVYFVTTRRITDKEGYITRDFFISFKRNFKTATLVFLVLGGIAGVCFLNLWIMSSNELDRLVMLSLPVQFLIFIEAVVVSVYAFSMLSRFDMNFKTLLKSAFVMANRHLATTMLCLVLLTATIIFSLMLPVFALLSVGTYCYISSFFLMKRFKKYRPDLDPEETR